MSAVPGRTARNRASAVPDGRTATTVVSLLRRPATGGGSGAVRVTSSPALSEIVTSPGSPSIPAQLSKPSLWPGQWATRLWPQELLWFAFRFGAGRQPPSAIVIANTSTVVPWRTEQRRGL